MTEPAPISGIVKSIESSIKTARNQSIEARHKEVKPFVRNQAKSIAIFRDWAHKEIWEFCMATHTNLADYNNIYIQTTDKFLPPEYLNEPTSVTLDEKGRMPKDDIRRLVSRKEEDDNRFLDCRICFGSGFALGVVGIICYDGQPQELIRVPCFCGR